MSDLAAQASSFLIVFARIGAVLMLLPVFSEDAVPGRIRLLVALGMSFGLYNLLAAYVPETGNDAALGATVVAELVMGLALGIIIRVMFLAITIAGSIISLQTGLTSAVVPDAGFGGQVPVVAKLISVAAAVVCLAMGLHHLWIGAIVRSYQLFPVGGMPPAADLAELAIATTARSMELGISLAGPLIIYGILFNVALGLSARLAPTIQVFFIAQPLNIMLGLALFTTTLGTVLMTFAIASAEWVQGDWS